MQYLQIVTCHNIVFKSIIIFRIRVFLFACSCGCFTLIIIDLIWLLSSFILSFLLLFFLFILDLLITILQFLLSWNIRYIVFQVHFLFIIFPLFVVYKLINFAILDTVYFVLLLFFSSCHLHTILSPRTHIQFVHIQTRHFKIWFRIFRVLSHLVSCDDVVKLFKINNRNQTNQVYNI